MRRRGFGAAARDRLGGEWRFTAACVAAAMTVGVGGVGVAATANTACAQDATTPAAPAASPQVLARPDSGRVTVGDPVTLRIHLRLPVGEQLAGATPDFREPLPEGVRLLRVDSLRLQADSDESGALVVAFFRPGTLRLPPIGITYRATRGAPADTAVTGPIAVTVTPVVPAGSGTLRDIRNIETAPISLRSAATVVAGALAVILAVVVASRLQRRRRMEHLSASRLALANAPAGPYATALARLAVIAEDWAASPDIESHYAETADVLRRYLADAHGFPALERTTPELLGALPSRLAVPPARHEAGKLLGAADLVKFALYAPPAPAPAAVLVAARSILTGWDTAGAPPGGAPPGGAPPGGALPGGALPGNGEPFADGNTSGSPDREAGRVGGR
jgi:hypothetical protein